MDQQSWRGALEGLLKDANDANAGRGKVEVRVFGPTEWAYACITAVTGEGPGFIVCQDERGKRFLLGTTHILTARAVGVYPGDVAVASTEPRSSQGF